MATPFSDLFEDFLQSDVTNVDLALYTPDFLSFQLSKWLKKARAELRDQAYNNANATTNIMEDIVESYRQFFEFEHTGTTFTQTLSPTPRATASVYVSVNNIETTDYTYNSGTGEIVINNLPAGENDIYIGFWEDGQFNQTLNLVVQELLVDYMAVTHVKLSLDNKKHLDQAVYGKDYGLHSQANHSDSLVSVYRTLKKDVETRMFEYTYRQSFDNLDNLGG